MDAERFDSFTRSLTTGGSRRRAMTTFVGGAMSLLALVGTQDVSAGDSGKCKPSCGECQQCDKGKCKRKNGKKRCKNGKCVAKTNGTACTTGTCQNGTCIAAIQLQFCAAAAECGNDSSGNMCACRDHESGQKACSKNGPGDVHFFPAGTPCSVCQNPETCFLVAGGAGGIECIRPCRG